MHMVRASWFRYSTPLVQWMERETSWFALLERIRSRTSAQDASMALKADVELIGKSWAAMGCTSLGSWLSWISLEASDGNRRPVWLLPETMSRRPPARTPPVDVWGGPVPFAVWAEPACSAWSPRWSLVNKLLLLLVVF